MIHSKSHPTYNERQQKIIDMIDWVLEKYKTTVHTKMTNQENDEEQEIIEDIIQELDKKRKIAINKKQKAINFLFHFISFFTAQNRYYRIF